MYQLTEKDYEYDEHEHFILYKYLTEKLWLF